jgi:hypothetical protein
MSKIFKRLRRSSRASFSVTSESPTSSNGVQDISSPTEFRHEWHVGFNQLTGNFDGLPPAWQLWLNNAKIRQVSITVRN